MRRFIQRRISFLAAIIFIALVNISGVAVAADPADDVEALQAQLEEAKAQLEKDKASHAEMAEKKRMIDEKLAERKARETKISDEFKQLCELQDKLKPGSMDSCLAKLGS